MVFKKIKDMFRRAKPWRIDDLGSRRDKIKVLQDVTGAAYAYIAEGPRRGEGRYIPRDPYDGGTPETSARLNGNTAAGELRRVLETVEHGRAWEGSLVVYGENLRRAIVEGRLGLWERLTTAGREFIAAHPDIGHVRVTHRDEDILHEIELSAYADLFGVSRDELDEAAGLAAAKRAAARHRALHDARQSLRAAADMAEVAEARRVATAAAADAAKSAAAKAEAEAAAAAERAAARRAAAEAEAERVARDAAREGA